MTITEQYGHGDNIIGQGQPSDQAVTLFSDIQRKVEEIVRGHGIDCPLGNMADELGDLIEETNTDAIEDAIRQGHAKVFRVSINEAFAGTSLHNVRMRSVLRMILAIIESEA